MPMAACAGTSRSKTTRNIFAMKRKRERDKRRFNTRPIAWSVCSMIAELSLLLKRDSLPLEEGATGESFLVVTLTFFAAEIYANSFHS